MNHLSKKIKPVLFVDFHGTLCHDKFWRSLGTTTLKKIEQEFFYEKNGLIVNWMKGKYSSEEINVIVANHICIDYKIVWEAFVFDCSTMIVSTSTLNKLKGLRNYFIVIMVTGNMDCFNRFTIPSLNLDYYFDRIINSYDTGKLKDENNGELFMSVVNSENSNIKDCILIDDSQDVCRIFNKLGGKALLVGENNIDNYLWNLRIHL